MVSDQGPTRPARDQQNDDDERRKRQARWNHCSVTVTAVNEGVQQRKQNGEHVANRVRSGQRTAPFAENKVNHENNGRKACRDQAGGDQPVGERLPHHIGGLPIGQIGDKSGREIGDGKRHKYRTNRFSTEGNVHPRRCVAAGAMECHCNTVRLPRVHYKDSHGEMGPTIARRFIRTFHWFEKSIPRFAIGQPSLGEMGASDGNAAPRSAAAPPDAGA